jgi:hypothetical protein
MSRTGDVLPVFRGLSVVFANSGLCTVRMDVRVVVLAVRISSVGKRAGTADLVTRPCAALRRADRAQILWPQAQAQL